MTGFPSFFVKISCFPVYNCALSVLILLLEQGLICAIIAFICIFHALYQDCSLLFSEAL